MSLTTKKVMAQHKDSASKEKTCYQLKELHGLFREGSPAEGLLFLFCTRPAGAQPLPSFQWLWSLCHLTCYNPASCTLILQTCHALSHQPGHSSPLLPPFRWDTMLPLATLNSTFKLGAPLECSHSTSHFPSQPFSNHTCLSPPGHEWNEKPVTN